MLNWEKNGLEIFDAFHIDFNLPKWKDRLTKNQNENDSEPMSAPRFTRFNRSVGNTARSGIFLTPTNPGTWLTVGGTTITEDGITTGASNEKPKDTLFDRIFGRAKKRRLLEEERIRKDSEKANFEAMEPPRESETKIEMTVEEFFASVKNSAEELALVKERYDNYEKAIEHLKRSGQIAMLEVMNQELEIHRAETQLFALGFRKIITEQNVVDFASKACRELRIDWIKNFGRVIPEEIINAKEKCDENLIFDNYVILHYDPFSNGVLKTQAEIEKERKKDPILFGVIAGSNKLYYVADWVDEYCDLTFDKIVEKLGEEAIKINDLTVDVKITRL